MWKIQLVQNIAEKIHIQRSNRLSRRACSNTKKKQNIFESNHGSD